MNNETPRCAGLKAEELPISKEKVPDATHAGVTGCNASRSIRLLSRGEIARHIAQQLQAVDTESIVNAAFDHHAGIVR